MTKIRAKLTQKKLPRNFFSVFKKQVLISATDETRKFAEEISDQAKRIIYDQAFNWQPLKPYYVRAKQRKELDERIYIATGEYVEDGVGWWERNDFVFVGPLPGTHHSGLSYKHLAAIHEYGTWTIPARPLWRPLASIVLRKSKKLLAAYIAGAEKAKRKAGKPKKKVTVLG